MKSKTRGGAGSNEMVNSEADSQILGAPALIHRAISTGSRKTIGWVVESVNRAYMARR